MTPARQAAPLVAGALVLLGTGAGSDRARPRGSDREPEKASVELAFAGYTSRASLALGGAAMPGQVQIDDAFLSLKDVRFRDQAACQAAGVPHVRGPFLAEVITGRITGADARASLGLTPSCGLEYTPRRASGEAPKSVRGYVVLVRGRRDDGVPFVIRSRRRDVVRLDALDPRGFSLRAGKNRLFLAVDLGAWMEGIDLASLPPGRGKSGVIRIDDGSHRDVLHTFEANLPAGIALFRDDDDDGALSARERSADRTLARGAR